MDITAFWNLLVVHPLELVLKTLANLTGSGGWAIIVMTLLVKAVLLPFSLKQTASMKAMQAIQPEVAALKKKYKDREKVTQETMKLYKERGINPAAGCVPMLPTMVVLFGLYWALMNLSAAPVVPEGVDPSLVDDPNKEFKEKFLGLWDLAHPDAFHLFGIPLPGVLPIAMAISQFFSSKMMVMPSQDPQQKMMNQMTSIIFPAMMLFWGVTFPAGLVLYWLVSNLFEMGRMYFTMGPSSLTGGGSLSLRSLLSSGGEPAEPDREAPLPPDSNGDTPGDGSRTSNRPGRARQKRGKRSGRR